MKSFALWQSSAGLSSLNNNWHCLAKRYILKSKIVVVFWIIISLNGFLLRFKKSWLSSPSSVPPKDLNHAAPCSIKNKTIQK